MVELAGLPQQQLITIPVLAVLGLQLHSATSLLLVGLVERQAAQQPRKETGHSYGHMLQPGIQHFRHQWFLAQAVVSQ
jgi:hypothetical protein